MAGRQSNRCNFMYDPENITHNRGFFCSLLFCIMRTREIKQYFTTPTQSPFFRMVLYSFMKILYKI